MSPCRGRLRPEHRDALPEWDEARVRVAATTPPGRAGFAVYVTSFGAAPKPPNGWRLGRIATPVARGSRFFDHPDSAVRKPPLARGGSREAAVPDVPRTRRAVPTVLAPRTWSGSEVSAGATRGSARRRVQAMRAAGARQGFRYSRQQQHWPHPPILSLQSRKVPWLRRLGDPAAFYLGVPPGHGPRDFERRPTPKRGLHRWRYARPIPLPLTSDHKAQAEGNYLLVYANWVTPTARWAHSPHSGSPANPRPAGTPSLEHRLTHQAAGNSLTSRRHGRQSAPAGVASPPLSPPPAHDEVPARQPDAPRRESLAAINERGETSSRWRRSGRLPRPDPHEAMSEGGAGADSDRTIEPLAGMPLFMPALIRTSAPPLLSRLCLLRFSVPKRPTISHWRTPVGSKRKSSKLSPSAFSPEKHLAPPFVTRSQSSPGTESEAVHRASRTSPVSRKRTRPRGALPEAPEPLRRTRSPGADRPPRACPQVACGGRLTSLCPPCRPGARGRPRRGRAPGDPAGAARAGLRGRGPVRARGEDVFAPS